MLWKRRPASGSTHTGQTLRRLYAVSDAPRFGIPLPEFSAWLGHALAKAGLAEAPAADRTAFFERIHLRDLVLARACARGNEIAWNEFMSSYRPMVVNAARRLRHDPAAAEELADSLYADLFGLKVKDGERISLLDSYLGTGSLGGWLRMVMAQREVEQWRRQRRLVPLDTETCEPVDESASDELTAGLAPVSALEHAVASALARLPEEGRLLLTLYYLDGKNLAEIGRFQGVHESTVSRRLHRLLQETRTMILGELGQLGMNAGAAADALHTDVRRLSLDVRQFLAASLRPVSPAPIGAGVWTAARATNPAPRQTLGDPT